MMKFLPLLLPLATVLATSAASAQCLFTSVTAQSVGPSCNFPSPGLCLIMTPPVSLTPSLDSTNCTLSIEVNAFEGCGATVPLRVLALGFQQVAVPLPEFGLGCTLHVLPLVLLATTSGAFVLSLPPSTSSLGFLAQGAVISLPPFGAGIFALSDGLSINLQ